jgi:uncharacterized protein YndB with AHSA1/START domain
MTATRSVVMEKEMPFAPEKVWRALTEGPLIKEWLMENDFEPVVGRGFQLRATPMPQWNGVIDCEVLVVEEGKKLAYRWGSMGVETVVEWTLAATSAGTMVRMEQSGFGEDREANYKGAMYGWQKFFGELEKVIGGLGR